MPKTARKPKGTRAYKTLVINPMHIKTIIFCPYQICTNKVFNGPRLKSRLPD